MHFLLLCFLSIVFLLFHGSLCLHGSAYLAPLLTTNLFMFLGVLATPYFVLIPNTSYNPDQSLVCFSGMPAMPKASFVMIFQLIVSMSLAMLSLMNLLFPILILPLRLHIPLLLHLFIPIHLLFG